MINIIFWLIFLTASIFILVKSSDLFTEKAEKMGKSIGFSSFVIGVTIVAMGTSLPELASSIVAVFAGTPEIVLGNAVGSNITNIFLVLGFAGIIAKKSNFKRKSFIRDLLFLLFTTILFTVFAWNGFIGAVEGGVLILILCGYLYKTVDSKKEGFLKGFFLKKKKGCRVDILSFALAIIGIYIGARFVVKSVLVLAGLVFVDAELIAGSLVALGTSLPELSVSLIYAKKGKLDIAVGNVLGSNIFNLLMVVGVPALFGELIATPVILHFMIPIMLIATILFAFISFNKKIKKYEAVLLLAFYVLFLFRLFCC